jgi:hypothetical protein
MKTDGKTKKADSRFVSHDGKLDSEHVSIEQGHPDPLTQTQDGFGVIESGNSQQAAEGSDPRSIGGEDERRVKPKSKVTLGTHRTSDDGFKKAESRHAHVRGNRKETEKLFAKSEDGAKRRQ